MSSILVISPKISEDSAKQLAEALEADYQNPYETKKRGFYKHKYLINYGFSKPTGGTAKKYNKASSVEISRDKIKCLTLLKDKCPTILFTEDKKEALDWINQGRLVVARELVKADNGKGLHYCTTKEEIDKVNAKFYTRYVNHTNELRVNVWKGEVVSVYDKVINKGNFKFNLINGQNKHPQLVEMVKQVHEITKLDWFGMDVLLTAKGNLYFLEVNSAPILFPYTLKKLVSLIKKEISTHENN